MISKYYILLIEQFAHLKLRYLILCALYHNNFYETKRCDIFLERYGLLDNTPKTLQEVALSYNLTRERIRQVVNKTTKYIKAKCQKDKTWYQLKEYLGTVNALLLEKSYRGILEESEVRNFLNKEFGNPDLQLFYLVNELLDGKFEISTKQSAMEIPKIQKTICECVKQFPNKYGKNGIAKILQGNQLKKNTYNQESSHSIFFGKLDGVKRCVIINQIQELINRKLIVINKVGKFAYPVLALNPMGGPAVTEEKQSKSIEEWVKIIETIIQEKRGWVGIDEIASIMNVERHDCLIKGNHLTTIAHLINRFLKRKGFKTKRIEYEHDYRIVVVAPNYSNQPIPNKYLRI